jgi:hypothetical protein
MVETSRLAELEATARELRYLIIKMMGAGCISTSCATIRRTPSGTGAIGS